MKCLTSVIDQYFEGLQLFVVHQFWLEYEENFQGKRIIKSKEGILYLFDQSLSYLSFVFRGGTRSIKLDIHIRKHVPYMF